MARSKCDARKAIVMPKVSVIVPTYNSAAFIRETLESILSQDYQDFEILIVDDASTDNTKDVVAAISSEKIRYLCLPQNHGGPSKARNVGITNAKGEFIAVFDSDDIMQTGRLSTAVSLLDTFPDVAMTFTDILKFNEKTGDYPESLLKGYDRFASLKKTRHGSKLYVIDSEQAYSCLFYENFVSTSSVTVRRSIFDKVGFFDEELTNADDLDMWFRITNYFNVGFIDAVTVRYRVSDGSISGRGLKLVNNRITVYRNRLNMDLKRESRLQAHKQIAINYEGMGYSYRCLNQMKEARRSYLSSLKEKLNLNVIIQFLITYLGNDFITFFRKIKVIFKGV